MVEKEAKMLIKRTEDEINLIDTLLLKMESQNFDTSLHKKKKLAIELIERTLKHKQEQLQENVQRYRNIPHKNVKE